MLLLSLSHNYLLAPPCSCQVVAFRRAAREIEHSPPLIFRDTLISVAEVNLESEKSSSKSLASWMRTLGSYSWKARTRVDATAANKSARSSLGGIWWRSRAANDGNPRGNAAAADDDDDEDYADADEEALAGGGVCESYLPGLAGHLGLGREEATCALAALLDLGAGSLQLADLADSRILPRSMLQAAFAESMLRRAPARPETSDNSSAIPLACSSMLSDDPRSLGGAASLPFAADNMVVISEAAMERFRAAALAEVVRTKERAALAKANRAGHVWRGRNLMLQDRHSVASVVDLPMVDGRGDNR